ncbi:MAG: TonB-dependent receptor [Bacteroidetes bacterium]|nr:MAG: TonB-dependent receptor [Bacteroidota bacterium]
MLIGILSTPIASTITSAYCILNPSGIQVEYHFDINSNTGECVVSKQHVERWRDSLICGFAVALLALVTGYSPVLAQESAEAVIEEIVVTGSRLRRSDLSAPSPTVVVTEQDVRLSGRGTLEGLLNELPQLNADNTSSTANISQAGLHTADLRSLGPERTLVLVNGKRFVPANESGLVDLSRIPDALIERIEIITGGASAVYGSDAIAGAINFILRDDFEGVDLRYNYGASTKDDGQTNTLSLTFGTNYADDRGNIIVSASWYDQDSVLFDDRSYSAVNFDVRDGELVRAGSSNIPGTRINLSTSEIAGLVGVDLTDFTTDRDFSAGGAGGCTRLAGVRFGTSGVPLPFCDPEDRFNTNPTNFLLRPLERYSISGLSHFEITEGVEVYAELFFTNNRNTWNLNAASFGPRTSGQNGLILPDYVNNPVLFQATRDFLLANATIFDPDGDGDAFIQNGGRRLNEAGSRFFNYDNTSYSLTSGLRGDLDLGGKDWQWDTYYQFQRATESQHFINVLSSLRLSLGVDVTVDPSTNEVRCTNEFVGCVPVNVLGLNSVTPEMALFLTPDKGDQEYFDRNVFQATMNGDLFEMPAGSVAAAFGFEWRERSYEFLPGGLNEGGVNGSQLASQNVETDVWELFTEVRIPLVEDMLSVELAYRYSDYSSSGGNDTYKVGLEYAPVEWLRFRGAFNRAVRAPNLSELFSPQTRSFEGGDDPCNSQLNPSQTVKDFCVLTGVPAADIDTFVPSIDLVGRRGGNPNLDVEESDTITLGFVVSPPFIEGLNVTVDWYDIEVTDAVTTTTAEDVVNTCFATLDANSAFCQSITRFQNGLIDEVLAVASNFATVQVSGVDLSFDYTRELPDSWGIGSSGATFALRGLMGWLFEREIQTIESAPVVDCAGFAGRGCSGFGARMVPDFGSKIDIRYLSGNFSTGLAARTIGEFDFVAGDIRGEPFGFKVPDETYWDIDANYQFNDSIQLHVIFKNFTDNEPQLMGQQLQGDSGVDVGLYDVIGSRFTVGFRYLFD